MRIEISNEADRATVAAILVKNGYRVWQGKERKTPTGKAYTYYVEAEKLTPVSLGREEAKQRES
nr:MAG TPA: hypothetical protein [Caudoviricetes sp.]